MTVALRERAAAIPPGGAAGSKVVDVKAAARHVAMVTVDRTAKEDIGIREIFV